MRVVNKIILVILFIAFVVFISFFIIDFELNEKNLNYKYKINNKIINNVEFMLVTKGPFTQGYKNKIMQIDYDYWIMKYEVTNQQYYNFLIKALKNEMLYIEKDTVKWNYEGDKLRPKNSYTAKILDDRIYWENNQLKLDTVFSNHPVTEVTWFGATAFCKYFGFSLPDKFEWEKAARGMTGWNYPWGDILEFNRANFHNSGDPFDNGTTPVGFYNGQNYKGYQSKDSPSPYGCYDMAGNAWEYTNTTLFKDKAVYYGGGGGFLYHTGAMIMSNYFSSIGYGCYHFQLDRPFKSDGFRCIIK